MTFTKFWDFSFNLRKYLTDIAKFQQFTKIISKLKCEVLFSWFLDIGDFILLSKYWFYLKLFQIFKHF